MGLSEAELMAIAQQELAAERQGMSPSMPIDQMPLSQGSVTMDFGGAPFGQQNTPKPGVSLPDDEIMRIAREELAQEQANQPSVVGEFGQGLVEGVTQLPQTVAGLASGAYNLARHPIDTVASDPRGAVETTGKIASGTSGAMFGGMAGLPLAPFTFGLSVPIGAALGGATGMYGFDKFNQFMGNEAPTTVYQDARNLGSNTSTGLALGAAGKAVGVAGKVVPKTLSKIASTTEGAAKGYAQEALGVRPSAIAKNLERGAVYLDDAGNQVSAANATDFTSKLEQRISNIQKTSLFKNLSNNPKEAFTQLTSDISKLNKTKDGMVAAVDESLKKSPTPEAIAPDWSIADRYIKSGKGTAGNKSTLATQLESIKQDWAAKKGTFRDLIDFKGEVDTGRVFANGPVDAAAVKLREAVLRGIKKSAEQTADAALGKKGAFEGINSQIADRLAVKDFLGKKAVTNGGPAVLRAAKNVANTPFKSLGVAGVPMLAGEPTLGLSLLGAKAFADAYPASMARGLSKVSRGANSANRAIDALKKLGTSKAKPVSQIEEITRRLPYDSEGMKAIEYLSERPGLPAPELKYSTGKNPGSIDPYSLGEGVDINALLAEGRGIAGPPSVKGIGYKERLGLPAPELKYSTGEYPAAMLGDPYVKPPTKVSGKFNPEQGSVAAGEILNALSKLATNKDLVRASAQTVADRDLKGRRKQSEATRGNRKDTQQGKTQQKTKQPPSPQSTKTVRNGQQLDMLLKALRKVESGGNDKAVSKVGAKGPYQLMDATGLEYHKKLGIKEPYDPFNEPQAKKIAEAILLDYTNITGSLSKGIQSYHSGPKNVMEGKLGPEGRKYLPAVLKALEAMG